MTEAWIVQAVRSPVARAHPEQGIFRFVRPDDLSASILENLVERSGIDPKMIDDVFWGCARQINEQGYNVARQAVLIAGLPLTVCGTTVNRNCGSSLEALHQAVRVILTGENEVAVAGGVEHMHKAGWDTIPELSPQMLKRYCADTFNMGMVCEHLAKTFQISRELQDSFALRSHQRASAASKEGLFKDEIIPTWGHAPSGEYQLYSTDQTIRGDTSLAALAKLKPAFLEAGTITAGNASPFSVGAAATLVMADHKAKALGLTPLAKVKAMAVAGNDPLLMGLGPVPAIQKILQRTGLSLNDIGIIEINEAFAAQVLSVAKELNIDPEKLNMLGGGLSLGHPLGATGARIITTVVHQMKRTKAKFALVGMCIGGGQGIATLLETVS
ncbi:MAG: thiolase family protein [Gemmataceae bacterium]